MKKVIRYFLFYSLLCNFVNAQIVFNRAYGIDTAYDFGLSNIQAMDNGYLIVGFTVKPGGVANSYFVKTNEKGDIEWTKVDSLSTIGSEVKSIMQLNDSSYIVAGQIPDTGFTHHEAFLLKLDKNGNNIWLKRYPEAEVNSEFEVLSTFDNGFILVYRTDSFSYGGMDAYLVKTDSDGIIEWKKNYGGSANDAPRRIVITQDSGFVFAGYIKSTSPTARFWLMKVNSKGDSLWQKTFAKGTDDGANDIALTLDGGFIMVGFTKINGQYDAYAVKTDSAGNLEWEKSFGGNLYMDTYVSVVQLSDSSYAIAGQHYDSTGKNIDGWLVKLSPQGEIIWGKGDYTKYGIDTASGFYNDDYPLDLKATSDGGFIMCGWVTNLGKWTLQDAWLVKTDCIGNADKWDSVTCPLGGVGIKEVAAGIGSKQCVVEIYPNPFSYSAAVRIANYYEFTNEKLELKIYDLLGREVHHQILNTKLSELNTNLPDGIYFYQMKNKEGMLASGKFIIQSP